MTIKYNNVYLNNTFTIGGIYEDDGPLGNYFDKTYKSDLYFGEKSLEKAEIRLLTDCVNCLLEKNNLSSDKIDLLISGDLDNQIVSSNYMARSFSTSFLGVFSACATMGEGLIIGSNFIDSKKINNVVVSTVSHNMVSEKQFRNPTEYGTLKPKTATFTTTGSAAVLLSNTKSDLKIESATIGKVIDLNVKDVNNMGAVMAPAAADTIYNHLTNLKRDVSYYDLIVTGDLGKYGKNILIEYMKEQYNIDISKNYNDCGVMLFDTEKQPVLAGASGPACSALVTFGYLIKQMKEYKIKKILYVPTGALFNPTIVFQKESIPAIAHAVSIEVVE